MDLEPEEVKFSREAARILHAPYFYREPEDTQDRQKVLQFFQQLRDEREMLEEALDDAQSYDDLSPEMQALWDKAKQSIEDQVADDLIRDRFAHDIPSIILPEEALKHRKITPEESALLTAAIIEAQIKGDEKAVAAIAELAKTPNKISEVLGGGRQVPYGQRTDEQDERAAPKPPRLRKES